MRITALILALFYAASAEAAVSATALPSVSAPATPAIGIAAVVDDQVISSLDLSDRMALVMGMTGIPDTEESRARLLPQILHSLIDEKLQMAEATRQGITVSDAKLQEGIARIEKQSGKPAGSLAQYLDSKGLSKTSFYAQVKAQIAWSEVIAKKIRPKVRISDQEVARYVKRKTESTAKAQQVMIVAIQLPVDAPANEPAVKKLADKLTGEIRTGASFDAVAAQFSSGTGGTHAPEAFWVDLSQLDPAIGAALAKTQKGGITEPVRTAAGYQIIRLLDAREAQESATPVADAPKTELAFKQILMALKPDAKDKEAQLLMTLAKEVAKAPGKCEDKSMAGAGDLASLDFTVTLTRSLASDLPEKLRDLLMRQKVGSVSEPVITPQGIRLFMLCERVDMPAGNASSATASSASDDAVREAIFTEKLQLEAQKYLRNMRRDAFIEVRQRS